eukprot:1315004-Pyramimonas_sp.AAC.1
MPAQLDPTAASSTMSCSVVRKRSCARTRSSCCSASRAPSAFRAACDVKGGVVDVKGNSVDVNVNGSDGGQASGR